MTLAVADAKTGEGLGTSSVKIDGPAYQPNEEGTWYPCHADEVRFLVDAGHVVRTVVTT